MQEYPKAFEILKLAQNISTTKHRNIIKIYIYTHIYNMSQATKKLKLCQHFLQTTPYMTHQSINHKKYEIFFFAHWNKAI